MLCMSLKVDLFVRSWVEILSLPPMKYLQTVDLFVRSWVEIPLLRVIISCTICRPLREVVSWNVLEVSRDTYDSGRPLREVVSWNVKPIIPIQFLRVDLFVRSWVEMLYNALSALLEMVDLFVRSWVEILLDLESKPLRICRPLREVVSWNVSIDITYISIYVDLFVRSWVEILRYFPFFDVATTVDLFVRSWVEIIFLVA